MCVGFYACLKLDSNTRDITTNLGEKEYYSFFQSKRIVSNKHLLSCVIVLFGLGTVFVLALKCYELKQFLDHK